MQVPVSPFDVITTSLAPAVGPAGVVPVICVALTTARLVSAFPPIIAAAGAAKLVPVIVTGVPPASGPFAGLMPVTVRTLRGPDVAQIGQGVSRMVVLLPNVPIVTLAIVRSRSKPMSTAE